MVTSASRSSAEMLTKFISGDSTGVDCGKRWERWKGKKKKKKESLVPVGLEEKLHPTGKLLNLGVMGAINKPPSAYLSIGGCGTGGRR